MRIALVSSDRGPCPPVKGGAIQLLISRVAPLLARRHDVMVFSITDPALPVRQVLDGVRFERFDKAQFLPRTFERIRQIEPDVVQLYNRPRWAPALRAAAPGAAILLSLHNLVEHTMRGDRQLARVGLDEADTIFTVSRFVADDAARRFPQLSGKLLPLYTGADLREYAPVWSDRGREWRRQVRATYALPAQDPVILFVGRLVKTKGCHVVLQAMDEVLAPPSHRTIARGGQQVVRR